jgi:hypothetical protein
MSNDLNSVLDYAAKLANYGGARSFEDNFKLAALCQEIYEFKYSGEVAQSELENAFNAAIVSLYKKCGDFRAQLGRFEDGKRLVNSLVSNQSA